MEDTINVYKIWGVEARRNPFPLYAQMRANEPVYRAIGPVSGHTFWMVTRYEDCVTVLKDPRFIKDADHLLTPEQRENLGRNDAFGDLNRHMLNLDPPDHTRLRGLVHKAFTPRMVENLRVRIEQIAATLLDDISASGDTQIDLIERFAFPLPITVIAELLGIPVEDRDHFRKWTKAILFGTDQQAAMMAGMEVVAYLHGIFDARRAAPQDDLISALLTVEEAGDSLSRQELISMIFLLLVAGHETTVNLIANGMLALLQHPHQQQMLLDDPSLIVSAIEEMLRYHGPVENTLARFAAEDTEFGGQRIHKGEIVMATIMAANRDPEAFDNPDTFDITRNPNRHIAFGSGIHYCLGAPLARLEGAIAIQALLRHLSKLTLAVPEDQLEWNDAIIIRGMKQMPVHTNID
jgi:cytochrome P450 PksS